MRSLVDRVSLAAEAAGARFRVAGRRSERQEVSLRSSIGPLCGPLPGYLAGDDIEPGPGVPTASG
jgi:hypothetical protein